MTEADFPTQPLWLLSNVLGIVGSYIVAMLIFIFFAPAYLIIYGAIMLVMLPFIYIVAVLKLKNFHYALEKDFFSLKQGIIAKQERKLPYGVIQNAMIERSLWDRIFGLTTLVIENAAGAGGLANMQLPKNRQQRYMIIGFNGNRIVIPGMRTADAEQLKQLVMSHIIAKPINESGL